MRKNIGIGIRALLGNFFFILGLVGLVVVASLFAAGFSPLAAFLIMALLAAVEAVAVVVIVVHVSARVVGGQGIIQTSVSSQLYETLFKLSKHVVLLGVFVVGLISLVAILTCPGGWSWLDRKEAPLVAETEMMQTAMNAMMAVQNIIAVLPNNDTNNSLGVNTWTGLPEGPGAVPLGGYLKEPKSTFYCCWDSKGEVYAQNKTDGAQAEADEAEKQRPCKRAP